MNKFTIDLKKGISYSKPYINKFSSNFDTVEFVMDSDDKISDCAFAVVYCIDGNAGMNVDGSEYLIKEYDEQNNVIKLTWLLGRNISCDDGVVIYQVVAYQSEDEKITSVWYSPQGRIVVGDSIDTTEYETLQIGSEPSLVSQFIVMANNNKNDIVNINRMFDDFENEISTIKENITSVENNIQSLDDKSQQLFENTNLNMQSIIINSEQISRIDNKLNEVDNNVNLTVEKLNGTCNELSNVKQIAYSNNDELILHEQRLDNINNDIISINKNISDIIDETDANRININQNLDKINSIASAVNKNADDISNNASEIGKIENDILSVEENIKSKVDKVEGLGLSEINFTSDDKKLLDTVSEKPGMITAHGGEIFNDYISNVAKGKYTTANGRGTIAGGDITYEVKKIAFNGYDAKRIIVNDSESLSNIKIGDVLSGEFSYDIDIGGYTVPGGTKTFSAVVLGVEYEEVILDRAVASDNLNAWLVKESHIIGTRYNVQTVDGIYNIEDSDKRYLHITGNGENDANRSNAYTLDKDGVAWFKGGVKIGGSNQDEGTFVGKSNFFASSVPQLEMTVEQEIKLITISELNGKPLADYNYNTMRIVLENAQLEVTGENSELVIRLNKNKYSSENACSINIPTTFINNSNKQYWGGYISLPENLYLSGSATSSNEFWRTSIQMPVNASRAMNYKQIERIYIQSTSSMIPVGTKIKVWFK